MATAEPVNKEVTLPPIEVSPTPEPAKAPALPEGFSLDSPTSSAGPDLPPGFTLDGMNVPTGDVSSGPTKDEPLTNIEDTKEAPFLQRLAAGFKMTPEGRKSYYEAMGHKIAVDQNGDMWAHDSQNGDFYPIDRKGLNIDDLADVMGAGARMAVEVAPQIGMAIYPPTAAASISPQGAAIGAGIGNVVSQAMSAALPGEDYPQDSFMREAGQRAMNVADAMAFSGVAQKGINAAGQIFDFFRPDNFAKRVTDKLLDTPEAKENLRISQSAKTPATLAQITNSPLARSSEKLALNYPSTSAHMKNAYNQQYQAAVTNLDNVLNTIHPGQVSNTFLGTKVGTAYEQTVKAAKAARRAAADQDFIITDSPLGKRPVIQASSTVAALKRELSNVSVRGFMAGPLMKNKEKELQDTLKSFVDKTGKPIRMTPKEMQIALESWGDAAGGSGKVFKDMETKEARTIRIASSVYRGLLNDLSNASQAGNRAR